MRHADARQDRTVHIALSRVRRRPRPCRMGALPMRRRVRPRRGIPRLAPLTWPEPGAPMPDELLLALMA
jgi:hypothetical protein